jgi:4-alpha-glucanotransferase
MLTEVLHHHAIDGHDLYAVASFLARTKSRLLAISLEDLLGVTDQPNIPGTVNQHPNWRRRLPLAIDEIMTAIDVSALKTATRERTRAAI